jgi:hypothetical protein
MYLQEWSKTKENESFWTLLSKGEHLPVHVICNQWNVKQDREPFAGKQKDQIEKHVDQVFRQNQLLQNKTIRVK